VVLGGIFFDCAANCNAFARAEARLNRINLSPTDLGPMADINSIMLHELIHLPRDDESHTHADYEFESWQVDGVARGTVEGLRTDDINACGEFCGGGCNSLNFRLGTHPTAGPYERLAMACARCATPENRSICGLKPAIDVEPVFCDGDDDHPDANPVMQTATELDLTASALSTDTVYNEVQQISEDLHVPVLPRENYGAICCHSSGGPIDFQCLPSPDAVYGHFVTYVTCDDHYDVTSADQKIQRREIRESTAKAAICATQCPPMQTLPSDFDPNHYKTCEQTVMSFESGNGCKNPQRGAFDIHDLCAPL
jgi:hypothetical protein